MAEEGTALVVGGTGGVGGEVVARLAAEGYQVVAGSSGASERSEGSVHYRRIDVRDADSVDAAFEAAAAIAPLQVVVGAHGIVRQTLPETLTETDLADTLDINLAGTVRVCRAAARTVSPGGAVVTVSSVGGARGFAASGVAYGASKAGLESITRYYAVALAERGIRFNTVVPGPLEHVMSAGPDGTSSVRDELGDFEAAIKALIPLGRPLSLAEVAGAVCFLASPAASGITGVALPVDGGLLAK